MLEKMLKRFLGNQQGGTVIFFGLAVFMLMTALGVAVDMGRVLLANSKAQTALDSAVLGASAVAAQGVSQQELDDRAQEFFAANFPTNYLGSTVNSLTINFDESTGVVDGSLSMDIETVFGAFVGLDTVDMNLNSEVTRILGQSLEVALVLDHTISMCEPEEVYGTQCANENLDTKFADLIGASRILINTIDNAVNASSSSDDTVTYSYIPFNQYVKVNDNVAYTYAEYLPNATGLRENGQDIITQLESTDFPDPDVDYPHHKGDYRRSFPGTNTAVGTLWGWRSLREADIAFFTGSSFHDDPTEHPAPLSNPDVIKAMILLTDGLNRFSLSANSGESLCTLPGLPPPPECFNVLDTVANEDQDALCDAMKTEAIRVYPILFVDSSTPGIDEVRQIFQDCAEFGEYFEPQTGEELRDAFRQIANDLISLRITR